MKCFYTKTNSGPGCHERDPGKCFVHEVDSLHIYFTGTIARVGRGLDRKGRIASSIDWKLQEAIGDSFGAEVESNAESASITPSMLRKFNLTVGHRNEATAPASAGTPSLRSSRSLLDLSGPSKKNSLFAPKACVFDNAASSYLGL
jgi:hypothetical protein